MNKSERLNDMMLFLNNRKTFNLVDLTGRYGISKSTAIRDIQSLEALGMPIYTTAGRNGHYNILPNRILSPIVFNIDEVHALYFAMLTLRAYESTPFHLSVERLKQKFENCLSRERIGELRRIERVFRLAYIQHNNQCPLLPEILKNTVDENVCRIRYGNQEKTFHVQFFEISSSFGQWYATAFNYDAGKIQVFRCDRIKEIGKSDAFAPQPLSNFDVSAEKLYKDETATDFEVIVTEKGVDMFYKEHYPSMKMLTENGQHVIKGFYNAGEERFISGYLLSYGTNLLSVSPPSLKQLLFERMDSLKKHLASI
jgi:predicted DNA-binding transcriptional regulator YafY